MKTKNKVLSFVTSVAMAGTASFAQATEEEFTLRVADSFPLSHIYVDVNKQWMDRIEELTEGQVTFEYYPAEQLAKSQDLLDAAVNGVSHISYVAPLYVSSRAPLSTVAAIPLVGNVSDHVELSQSYWDLAIDELNEHEYLPQGVRVIRAGVTPAYQMMTVKDPVTTIDDLKGLKIRSSGGIQEESVEALGAIPVGIPAPDLYPALQRGTIDGVVFNIPSSGGYKLQELLGHVTTNVNLGVFPVLYVINENLWQEFPEDIKDAFMTAGSEMVAIDAAAYTNNYEVMEEEFAKHDVNTYEVSSDELSKWSETLKPVQEAWVKNLEDNGLPAEKVFQTWEESLTK
jgi:TRAP-type C4-dicarboxylate transport system substrate-binding protein